MEQQQRSPVATIRSNNNAINNNNNVNTTPSPKTVTVTVTPIAALVDLLLDINSQLLRECLALQQQTSTPAQADERRPSAESIQTACVQRLHANLAFLASLADRPHKGPVQGPPRHLPASLLSAPDGLPSLDGLYLRLNAVLPLVPTAQQPPVSKIAKPYTMTPKAAMSMSPPETRVPLPVSLQQQVSTQAHSSIGQTAYQRHQMPQQQAHPGLMQAYQQLQQQQQLQQHLQLQQQQQQHHQAQAQAQVQVQHRPSQQQHQRQKQQQSQQQTSPPPSQYSSYGPVSPQLVQLQQMQHMQQMQQLQQQQLQHHSPPAPFYANGRAPPLYTQAQMQQQMIAQQQYQQQLQYQNYNQNQALPPYQLQQDHEYGQFGWQPQNAD